MKEEIKPLDKDYILETPLLVDTKFTKKGVNYHVRGVSIVDDVWTFPKGWESDGATVVWDGPIDKKTGLPKILPATLIHDFGYDELRYNPHKFPYNRRELDVLFYVLMRKTGFRFAKLYFIGVRMFGRVAQFFAGLNDKLKK